MQGIISIIIILGIPKNEILRRKRPLYEAVKEFLLKY